jgi:hypothetical protein
VRMMLACRDDAGSDDVSRCSSCQMPSHSVMKSDASAVV